MAMGELTIVIDRIFLIITVRHVIQVHFEAFLTNSFKRFEWFVGGNFGWMHSVTGFSFVGTAIFRSECIDIFVYWMNIHFQRITNIATARRCKRWGLHWCLVCQWCCSSHFAAACRQRHITIAWHITDRWMTIFFIVIYCISFVVVIIGVVIVITGKLDVIGISIFGDWIESGEKKKKKLRKKQQMNWNESQKRHTQKHLRMHWSLILTSPRYALVFDCV